MGAGGVLLDLSIVLTAGKYAVLVGIYTFALVVFRGIIKQLAAESRRGQEVSAGGRRRQVRSPRPHRAAHTRPHVASEPEAPPQPQPEPEVGLESEPAASEPLVEPEPVSIPEPGPRPELPQTPVASAAPRPPALEASKINLLEEFQVEEETQSSSQSEPVQREGGASLLVIESVDEAYRAGDNIALSAAVTIGRSEENSLQISDRFISSRHALICLRDGRRILVDRDSTNGTFVNGRRIEEEVELSDGDRIAMGNTVFEYHAG